MDKKILLILGLLILAAVVVAFAKGNFKRDMKISGQTGPFVSINGRTYMVEIVSSVADQARGLSGRDSLAEGSGMLFVYTKPFSQAFWMKGMKFPIDIIWILDGKVIGFVENAPVEAGMLPTIYNSPGPVDRVLELPAGTVAKDGIRVGDIVSQDGAEYN